MAARRRSTCQGKFAVILPAAGRSSRFGDPKQKKIYAELEGGGMAARRRAVCQPRRRRPDHHGDRRRRPRAIRAPLSRQRGVHEHQGDRRRGRTCDTVARALESSTPLATTSPFTTQPGLLSLELIDAVFRGRPNSWCRPPCRTGRETIKRAGDENSRPRPCRARTLPRPDAASFPAALLFKAYAQRSRVAGHVTDDCQLVEASASAVRSSRARH